MQLRDHEARVRWPLDVVVRCDAEERRVLAAGETDPGRRARDERDSGSREDRSGGVDGEARVRARDREDLVVRSELLSNDTRLRRVDLDIAFDELDLRVVGLVEACDCKPREIELFLADRG